MNKIVKIFTPDEMRNVDSYTISHRGVSEFSLMENAALAAFFVLQKHFPVKKKTFVILCGGGNNGGDGLTLARKLFSQGAKVLVVTAVPVEKYNGSALQNYNSVVKYNIPIHTMVPQQQLLELLQTADIIVDALLGTGLKSTPMGIYKEYIEIVNSLQKPVLALDIPSGTDGSNGSLQGVVINADITVTFGSPKWGNVLYPAAEKNGKLYYSRLSFSPKEIDSVKIKGEILIPQHPPKRDISGHKGSFGRVLTIGGAHSYFGAPAFSARAVLKTGAGYSYMAAPKSITASWAPHAPELVYLPQKENKQGNISIENKNALIDISKKVRGIILGPGLSQDAETLNLSEMIFLETEKPLLLDGDGLAILNKTKNIKRNAPLVLTPHLGEFMAFSGESKESIKSNYLDIVRKQSDRWNAILVLKGPHSLVVLPGGEVFVNLTGNNGMGTAGSGDVLCGVIMGLYAQGMELSEAVKAGVFLHGLAGDNAAESINEATLTASDILSFIPQAYSQWENNDYTLPLQQVL